MAIVITYDIDTLHEVVKERMVDVYGYKKYLTGLTNTGTTASANLPNTTLYHSDKTLDAAESDLKAVIRMSGCVLQRYAIFTIQVNSTWRIMG